MGEKKIIKPKSILLVCTGNTCRSIMAKGLLEKAFLGKKITGIEVISSGVFAFDGISPTPHTIEVMKELGIDVSGEKAKKTTKELIDKADVVLAMEDLHEQEIVSRFPDSKNKVFLLSEYVSGDKPLRQEVPDPIGHSLEFYRSTLNLLKEYIGKLVNLI